MRAKKIAPEVTECERLGSSPRRSAQRDEAARRRPGLYWRRSASGADWLRWRHGPIGVDRSPWVAGVGAVYKDAKKRGAAKRKAAEESEIRAHQLRQARGQYGHPQYGAPPHTR